MPVRIGVDVGGTNTDAVLMDGDAVLAWTKQATTPDVGSGISDALTEVLRQADVAPGAVAAVMIGTTHFTNALVERRGLDAVGVLRLASPSGEALPPLTGWPPDLAARIGDHIFLLAGGHEMDGREIAPLDEAKVRDAAGILRAKGIDSVAVSSVFAAIDPSMERRAALIIQEVHPRAAITLSHTIGRVGLIERENAAILNASLGSLAARVVKSFERALLEIGIYAPLYISQNDGTLISADEARCHPVLTMGSGPTNSMRGAAFLTVIEHAIVIDVGGTTADIGVLANGFPRECSIAVDIGGVRTNFRMPDILAIGLGGGTRIHLDPALYQSNDLRPDDICVGPDSVGFRIEQQSHLFGGDTMTASDIAVAAGHACFGDADLVPKLSSDALAAILQRMRAMIEEGVDRMKTAPGDAAILVVGGADFLVPKDLKGAAQVIRPPYAGVANAVGAAIAQVSAQVEKVASYDAEARETVLARIRDEATAGVIAAGGDPKSVEVVEIDELFLSYMPGRTAYIRLRAIAELALGKATVADRIDNAH